MKRARLEEGQDRLNRRREIFTTISRPDSSPKSDLDLREQKNAAATFFNVRQHTGIRTTFEPLSNQNSCQKASSGWFTKITTRLKGLDLFDSNEAF
jgi:hypothetical protein